LHRLNFVLSQKKAGAVLAPGGWGTRGSYYLSPKLTEVLTPWLNTLDVQQREAIYALTQIQHLLYSLPAPRHAMFRRFPMPKRILIVEDEVSVRNAVRTFLEHQSRLEVCGEAANGLEALEKATQLRPDLVLLDLSMPIMNGVEVASLIRSRMPNTPVVVYTTFDDVLGKPLAATLGIAAIVSKSDGLAKLLARIEALLESSTLVQPPA
jgi:CheY-like chemotaxis protein